MPNQFAETPYIGLENSENFTVTIDQVGERFKMTYRDTREANRANHIIITKWWETRGAANQFIAHYRQMKGVKTR